MSNTSSRNAKYIEFMRNMVENHTYKPDGMGNELVQHQTTLGRFTLGEAMEEITAYSASHTEICCLYAVVSFLKNFPDANARMGFVPEENPLRPKPNRLASKVVLILDGYIYDLVEMIGHKEEPFEQLYSKYCKISIPEYCKRALKFGEVLTILPPISGHETENFVAFFFQNEDAITYSISAS